MQVSLIGSSVTPRMYAVGQPTQLNLPTYDGSGQGVHPSVVYIPQGFGGYKYWMAFTPYANGNDQLENPSILASNDGTKWIVPPGVTNPLVATPAGGNFNRDVELIFDAYVVPTKMYMYYGNSLGEAYRMETTNGVNWSVPTILTGGYIAAGSGVIVRRSATEWIALDGSSQRTNYLKWVSKDGIAWERSGHVPHNLQGISWHTSGFVDAAGVHFLASSYALGAGNLDNQLYYGFSKDGQNVNFESFPIIHAEIGTFYSRQIYYSSMIHISGDKYRIYFSSTTHDGQWWIGYQDVRFSGSASIQEVEISRTRMVPRTLWSALAVRDTNAVQYSLGESGGMTPIPEWNQHKYKALFIRNSMDQDVKLSILVNLRGNAAIDVLNFGIPLTPEEITIPKNSGFTPFFVDETVLKSLGKVLPWGVGVQLKASIAPTTGDISVYLSAWN